VTSVIRKAGAWGSGTKVFDRFSEKWYEQLRGVDVRGTRDV